MGQWSANDRKKKYRYIKIYIWLSSLTPPVHCYFLWRLEAQTPDNDLREYFCASLSNRIWRCWRFIGITKTNYVSAGLIIHKRRLKAKLMGVFKVRTIALDYFGVDSILFDLAVPEIFYFKQYVKASLVVIFVGNPNVDNTGDAISVLS